MCHALTPHRTLFLGRGGCIFLKGPIPLLRAHLPRAALTRDTEWTVNMHPACLWRAQSRTGINDINRYGNALLIQGQMQGAQALWRRSHSNQSGTGDPDSSNDPFLLSQPGSLLLTSHTEACQLVNKWINILLSPVMPAFEVKGEPTNCKHLPVYQV